MTTGFDPRGADGLRSFRGGVIPPPSRQFNRRIAHAPRGFPDARVTAAARALTRQGRYQRPWHGMRSRSVAEKARCTTMANTKSAKPDKRKGPLIFRRFRKLPNGKVLDAHDYGHK